jgi:hypothetical protein
MNISRLSVCHLSSFMSAFRTADLAFRATAFFTSSVGVRPATAQFAHRGSSLQCTPPQQEHRFIINSNQEMQSISRSRENSDFSRWREKRQET